MSSLDESFTALKLKLNEKLKRLDASEKAILDEKEVNLVVWKKKLASLEAFMTEKQNILSDNKGEDLDLQTLEKVRQQLEDEAKDMELQEKKLLSSTIRFGESLKDSSAFSLNDIKQIDEDSQVHRENWDNLKDEMDWRIKRILKKESEYKLQASTKLEEWDKMVSPLYEWFAKMDRKLENMESIDLNKNTLTKLKQDYLGLRKELELQEKRIANVAAFGEEITQHPTVSQDQKRNIQQDITQVANEWEQLNEKVAWRISGVEERERVLDSDRLAKLEEWKVSLSRLQEMLVEQEDAFKEHDGVAADLETVMLKTSEIEEMLNDLELGQKKELQNLILFAEEVFDDPSMSNEDNRKIKQDVGNIRHHMENLEEKMKWRAKRLSEKEEELKRLQKDKLKEWQTKTDAFQTWLNTQDLNIQALGEISNDLDEVRELKSEAEALVNKMDNGKIKFKDIAVIEDELQEHPSFLEEDRRMFELQMLTIQELWNKINAKLNLQLERMTSKEAELDVEATRVSIDWRNRVTPLSEWINLVTNTLKTEDHHLDIEKLKRRMADIEATSLDMQEREEQLQNAVSLAYKIQEYEFVSASQKRRVLHESTTLKQNWDELENSIEDKAKSLYQSIRICEEEGNGKLSSWRETCKPLSDWLDKAVGVVRLMKFDVENIDECQKQIDTIQSLLNEGKSMEPQFDKSKETGDTLSVDLCLSEEERSHVDVQCNELHLRHSMFMETSQERKKTYERQLEDCKNHYQQKKLEGWKQVSEPIENWIESREQAFQSLQNISHDVTSLKKQQESTKSLALEVSAYQTEIDRMVALNDEISNDPLLPEEVIDNASMKTKRVKSKWYNLREMIETKSESLSMKLTTLLNERQRRLSKWNDKVLPIGEWLNEKEHLLTTMPQDSLDHDDLLSKKNKFVNLVGEIDRRQEMLRSISETEIHVIKHPSLSQEEFGDLMENVKNLMTLASTLFAIAEQIANSFEETFDAMETEQNEKIAAWNEELNAINVFLFDAENVVTQETVVGADMSTVKTQRETLVDILEQCITSQDRIYKFTELSDYLQHDPCISSAEGGKIASTANALNKRWDLVLAQLKARNKALEEQLDDLEDKHKSDLFGHWQDKFSAFSDWLANTENAVEGLKDIADNVLLVQEQQVETQELISELTSKEPDINEVFSIAQTVSDDPLIEDNEASSIEKQANELSGRWVALNETLKGRSNSLQIRGVVLNKEEQQLLHEWHRNVEPFNSWLSKVEDDGSMIVDDSVDVNAIKDYSIRVKTLESEIQGRKPVLEEIVKLGEQLLSNTVVRDEEKVHIAEEMEIFEDRWSKLNVKIHENNKWADMKLMELAKKERESLDVWRRNVDPFIVWLEETQGKLDAIQETSTELENLKEKHLALQSIKQDVMGHEEALARIIAIVGKLTKDENVSETEKMNVKAEMSRLQEKWNRAQNNVHLKYLSVTESLMELAQKEKLTLEEWKKLTDPFKEWLVEAKGRFENLQHEKGYDAALINQEKLTALSQEINDHELNYENIAQLKDTIIQDEHLSVSFKDNIRNEADTLGTKWFELKDNVASQGESVQSQIVFLDVSQRDQLERWRFKSQALRDKHVKVKSDLLEFENMALNLDGLKKKFTDLKKTDDEIKENRSEMETVSAFASEIFNDPNVVKNEKSRVKSEADSMDEQQGEQEKMSSEYHRRLEEKIQEKEGLQSSKYENWKIATQPLHEWLDGIEEDAKDMDTIGSNIADVQKQCDGLEKLSNEFKDGESDLFNILNMGEELSIDSQLSEDVRTTVRQDISSLKENHSNIADLLKSQREKMKSHYMKLQQHQEKSLIDWNERKTSLDARIKTMDKRTGQWPTIGNTMHEVESQNAIVKAIETDLESMEWELNTVSEFGESLCEDVSILDAKKETVREEMTTMKNAFDNCQKNVVDRKSRLEAKLEELQNAHKSELLAKWEMSLFKTSSWIEICEDSLDFDEEDQKTLSDVRKRMDEIDDLLDSVDGYKDQYDSTLDCGELVLKEPSIESNEKEKVEKDLISLKERWRAIGQNIESIVSRLEKQESSFSDELQVRLAKWRQEYEVTMLWREEEKMKLEEMEKDQDEMGYDRVYESTKILEEMLEMLPLYENKVDSLTEKSDFLVQNSNEREARQISNDMQALKSNIGSLKIKIESMKSSFVAKVREFDNIHGSKYSDWSRKDEKIERKISNIEEKWKEIKFLENSNEEEVIQHRVQLEDVVADINNLQPDFDRHCSLGHQLSKEPALNSELRTSIEDKVASHENRWKSFGILRKNIADIKPHSTLLLSKMLNSLQKIYMLLPRIEVIEPIVKVEERQVESMADMTAFDDLFGSDSDRELKQWYVDYDVSLTWCNNTQEKIQDLSSPEEEITLVEEQHDEIEELIQLLTTHESSMSRVLDKGQYFLENVDTLRISKNDRIKLDGDLKKLREIWDEIQENAFDIERSLNKHLNKLKEFEDWLEKSAALSQWLEMTNSKLDCCSEVSDDVDEQDKQRTFLQKFVTEKKSNEESINDVLNLGRYIVTNQLILREKYQHVNDDVVRFKELWNKMLVKADMFCKTFGIPFTYIDMNLDPLAQWKKKVEEIEKWIVEAREKLLLKDIRDFAALKALPEIATDISKGIENYCLPQLDELTSRAQDILNENEGKAKSYNAEVTATISRVSKEIQDLRTYTESQKVHVRNETLAFFTQKLNGSEAMVDRILEDLKKLRTVEAEANAVRDQVNLIKKSEEYLQEHLLQFEESKRQIIEMEDKGYISTDGFEGTLKVKSAELEPRISAVERQFADTKNRLAKGVITFHGHHKDDVKKWLRYCERKMNEIDNDVADINQVYDEYCKLQELRREISKGEQSYLNTLELNERLIAEAMLNDQQVNEYQGEMISIAKSRNKLQRRLQEKNSRLYARLIEGLNQLLSSSIHTFEEVETTVSLTTLSDDFDTATEQMDGAKNVAESVSKLEAIATENLELASKITTCGILILNEEDKVEVDEKIKKLKEWANEITGKARSEFNRLFDDYLVLFRKEIDERKAWITNSENRMSLNYLEIATLEGFEEALTEHKQFEEELSQKNMAKMVDASDRVPELENNHKVDVKNLERRWKILKQWSDEYSLGLRTIIKEWKEISRDQDLVIQWLDPNEEKLSKICEKIHWANVEALKKQIQDLKNIQSKLEDNGLLLSNSHVKGMMLMKFLSDEAAASKAIDNDLSQLDRRWNKMAKDIIARIELLRNIQFKQADIVDKKRRVNTYIDETNSDLDEHETKTQRLRGNVSDEMENGETEKERKTRLKKEKEDMQEDVIKLVKSLEEKISMFANYQTLVDRINHASKELEDVADDESKLELHDDLANFNARWQVIVTRLEEYSDNDLPDSSMLGCMGFVKRKFSSSTF